jgi:hypothetical protein
VFIIIKIMNKSRIALLVVAIAAAVVCLGFMGIRAFTQRIYDGRSCQWANIDNIEMHVKIDVPETAHCDCRYDQLTRTKSAVFTLVKNEIPDGYAQANRLEKISKTDRFPIDFKWLRKHPLDASHNLYFREAETKWDDYKLLYDESAGKLYVSLRYLD